MANFELWPFERGKLYVIPFSIMVCTPRGDILLYKDYVYDADSVVINIVELTAGVPKYIIPAVHDFGYDYQCDCKGRLLPKSDWDYIYYWLSLHSNTRLRRSLASIRYWGLKRFASRFWDATVEPLPIPAQHAHMYGTSQEAWLAQHRVPQLVVNVHGRLELLPAPIKPVRHVTQG